MVLLSNAYIDIGEYVISLVYYWKDDTGTMNCRTRIGFTGVKPPTIDSDSLDGRQMLWVIKNIKDIDAGEFPRD